MAIRWLAVAAAAVVVTGPVDAACPPERVCVDDPASVVRGLQAAGYKAELKHADDGHAYVLSATNGNDFTIGFEGCDDYKAGRGCTALLIGNWWEKKPYIDIALANAFNLKSLYGRAYLNDAGELQIEVVVDATEPLTLAAFTHAVGHYGKADGDIGRMIDDASDRAMKKPAATPAPRARAAG